MNLATITWDLTPVTNDMASLGTALLAGVGLAIGGALVVYGIKVAVPLVLGIFKRVTGKG